MAQTHLVTDIVRDPGPDEILISLTCFQPLGPCSYSPNLLFKKLEERQRMGVF